MSTRHHHTITLVAGALLAACGGVESPATTPVGTEAVAAQTTTTIDAEMAPMVLTSSAFVEQDPIPAVYTCDGENISPPLHIEAVPAGTSTLVLIVDDPDAPGGTWDHWVAFDIPPASDIPEDVGALGTAGINSFGTTGYGGPCPPSGTHRYVFQVYALDTELGLAEGAGKQQVVEGMDGHVLDEATLTGLYGE